MSTALPPAQTEAQLRQQAADLVGTEIQSQIDPLQSQAGTLAAQSDRAASQIGSMFDDLQPTVQQGAQNVQTAYTQAEQAQQQIFANAQQGMNQLAQQRAAEAQRLAQQIGGPVAVNEFTAGFDEANAALINLGAGQELHTLAYGLAGVQQAEQFAGQVFPVMRTEQVAQARAYYNDQIKEINDQIAKLNASRGSQINSRFLELQQQNLQYKLQQAQLNLQRIQNNREYALAQKSYKLEVKKADHDWKATLQQIQNDRIRNNRDYQVALKNIDLTKIKNDRDWKAALASIKNEKDRIALAKSQLVFDQGRAVGIVNGTPTLDAKNLDIQERSLTLDEKKTAAAINMDQQEYLLNVQKLAISTKYANQKLQATQKATWASYLDQAVNPQPGKAVVYTTKQPVSAQAAVLAIAKGNTDVFEDKSSPTGYSKIVQRKETPITDPILEPNALVDYLVAHGQPKALAIKAVKARLGLPDWKYGQKIKTPAQQAAAAKKASTEKQLKKLYDEYVKSMKSAGSDQPIMTYEQFKKTRAQNLAKGSNAGPSAEPYKATG